MMKILAFDDALARIHDELGEWMIQGVRHVVRMLRSPQSRIVEYFYFIC
jgi:hypothetical protein